MLAPKLVARTRKTDWFTERLARSGALVSGHPTFAERLGLDSAHAVTLRFIRSSSGILLVLLCVEKASGVPCSLAALGRRPLVQALDALFGGLRLLAFPREGGSVFGWMDGTDASVEVLTDAGLQERLARAAPALLDRVGARKPINRTVNDAFQDWTRARLSRSSVVNDLDALTLPFGEERGVLWELKRPRAALQAWGPYLNDASNYEAAAAVAAHANLENRTVAYSRAHSRHVALFRDVRLEQGALVSRHGLVAPEAALAIPLGAAPLTLHRSTMGCLRTRR